MAMQVVLWGRSIRLIGKTRMELTFGGRLDRGKYFVFNACFTHCCGAAEFGEFKVLLFGVLSVT